MPKRLPYRIEWRTTLPGSFWDGWREWATRGRYAKQESRDEALRQLLTQPHRGVEYRPVDDDKESSTLRQE